ncbi:hypothetical protein EIP91_009752 [Steccherinum ochraceum]|uniref:BTB domain-containing protein n=1 Tax=Steccherinum ochraceum TaxID=92696 RepID=A0A4R0R6P8_9APHY|nr:hypothetical protein EIP91_009752 [Steccherinum ochraceum]
MALPRGKKRKTSKGAIFSEAEFQKSSMWFEDGNVVLVAENTGYKVFKGVLSLHSEVFQDLFTLPQPQDAEIFDDCYVVRMPDSQQELACLLSAIHDSSSKYLDRDVVLSFPEVSSMLRVGSKYQVKHLRAEAVRRLKCCFPDNLDDYVTPRTRYDLPDDVWFPGAPISLELGECIAVINLARAHDLDCLLPAAFYACAQMTDRDLVFGFPGADGTRSTLSKEDLVRCLEGRASLVSAWRRDVELFLFCLPPCDEDRDPSVRSVWKHCLDMSAPLLDSTFVDDVLRLKPSGYCNGCVQAARRSHNRLRQSVWDGLGEHFDLHPLGVDPNSE